MLASGTVVAIMGAISVIASIILQLLQNQWSGKSQWEKEYSKLLKEYADAEKAHKDAVATGDPNHMVLYDARMRAGQACRDHYITGQRKGYIDRT